MNNEYHGYLTEAPVTHLCLCSGYDGVGRGLKRFPKPANNRFVEREGFPIANLVAKAEANEMDTAPVFTDVKTFPYDKFRGCVDVLSAGFHANPFPVAVNDNQPTTQDTCTRGLQMELPLADHDLCCLRTSKESFQPRQETVSRYCSMSLKTWKQEVTSVRGAYLVRVKSARPTNANESSSWPTSTARDWKGAYSEESQKKKPRNLLPDAVKKVTNYPTPRTSDAIGASQSKIKRVKDGTMPAGKAQLREWVQPNWYPTIRAQEPARTTKGYGRGLAELVEGKEQIDLDSPPVPTNDNTSGKNRELLSPNWVEQLMGVPVGLTQLPTELID